MHRGIAKSDRYARSVRNTSHKGSIGVFKKRHEVVNLGQGGAYFAQTGLEVLLGALLGMETSAIIVRTLASPTLALQRCEVRFGLLNQRKRINEKGRRTEFVS